MRHSFITKRPNGIYYIVTPLASGGKAFRSTGCKRKSDAIEFFSREHSTLSAKTPATQTESKAFLPLLIESVTPRYHKHTVAMYRQYVGQFIAFANKPLLADITPLDVDRYRTHCLRSKLAPVTVSIQLRTIRSAFRWGRRMQLIDKTPFDDISIASAEKPPVHLSVEDFMRILKVIDKPWMRDVVLFAAGTGMRLGEVANVLWSDVDLLKGELTVRSNANFKTKNGKTRLIPLNKVAESILRSRMPLLSSERVFHEGKASRMSHLFKRYVRKVGEKEGDGPKLPETIHFHTLRHSFATWLAQRGERIEAIQKLLGHSSPVTTQIYAHLTGSDLHGVVKNLPAFDEPKSQAQ